jgi:DNA-binding transcriptional ArsR family regulator
MENHQDPLDTTYRALADPTRRAVIARLISGPAAVKDLAAPFDMGLPSFLKHVKVLEDSGLIASEKRGRVRTCHLNPKRMAAAEGWLSEQRAIWEGRTDRLASHVEAGRPEENPE